MMRQRPSGSGYGGSNNYYGGYGGGNAGGGSGGYSNSGYGGYTGGGHQQNYGGYSGGNNAYGSSPSSSTSSVNKKYSKHETGTTFSMGKGNLIILYCVLTVLWGAGVIGSWYNVRTKRNTILAELNQPDLESILQMKKALEKDVSRIKRQQEDSIQDLNNKYGDKHADLEKENRQLQKERDELRIKYEGPDKKEEEARLLMREKAFQEQVFMLQEATRKESRRTVLERFGTGPYEVEFAFEIEDGEKSFVIEMAPLDEVPHAVHTFLEQVDHGLWVGCAFYLNGPHVLQLGPSTTETEDETEEVTEEEETEEEYDDRESAMKPFRMQGLDSLAFPDYSPNFPHDAWTVGFTGRPGGPDFYINKADNTHTHGPHGQPQHALEEQGDSCFGKITLGRENVTALFSQPTYQEGDEWDYYMVEPVFLTKARVLNKPGEPVSDESESQQSVEQSAEQPPKEDEEGQSQLGDEPAQEGQEGQSQLSDQPPQEEQTGQSQVSDQPPQEKQAGQSLQPDQLPQVEQQFQRKRRPSKKDTPEQEGEDEEPLQRQNEEDVHPHIQQLADKLKRRPRLPKINHGVDP